jgi:hypothetical protein
MRPIAAALLLCLYGALFPAATVLALVAPQQGIPACCRAHGAHHCMMAGVYSAESASNPAFRPFGCPYNHGFQVLFSGSASTGCQPGSSLARVITVFSPLTSSGFLSAPNLHTISPRGPPSFSLFYGLTLVSIASSVPRTPSSGHCEGVPPAATIQGRSSRDL